jgi:hypothetical protein
MAGRGEFLVTSIGQALLTQATTQFPDLSEAEKELLCAVVGGGMAEYSMPNKAGNAPKLADNWGGLQTICATVLRWLCLDHQAIRHIDPKGISIMAAEIKGPLDLEYAAVPFPLHLRGCVIPDGVKLIWAKTQALTFDGSVIGASGGAALMADGIHVDGDLKLRGVRAMSGVSLVGATIAGAVECDKAGFYNPNGRALSADRIRISGDLFLRGVEAKGEVRLVGAKIARNLSCVAGAFCNPGKSAFTADGAQVGGALLLRKAVGAEVEVLLREAFQAEGEVRLTAATIADDLDCNGGCFATPVGLP